MRPELSPAQMLSKLWMILHTSASICGVLVCHRRMQPCNHAMHVLSVQHCNILT